MRSKTEETIKKEVSVDFKDLVKDFINEDRDILIRLADK